MNKPLANLIAAFIPGSQRRKMVRRYLTSVRQLRPYVYRSYHANLQSGDVSNAGFIEIAGQYEFNPPGQPAFNPAWKVALTTAPSRILEIGSWQGSSAVAWNHLYPKAKITCVDFWAEYNEMDFRLQPEKCFDANIADFADRVRKVKSDSALALAQFHADGEQFDCIFIDGSHFEDSVLTDTMLAWRLLPVGGVLVWDDYNWTRSHAGQLEYGDKTPKPAIDHFLKRHHGEYAVLSAFPQVIVKRTHIFRDGTKFTPLNKK